MRLQRAFKHEMQSTQEREATSIFDSLPVRRADTWVGPDRLYITDDCAYEWDRAPQPPVTSFDICLKTPICKQAPRSGGSAMFKDLTKDYLKAALASPKVMRAFVL